MNIVMMGIQGSGKGTQAKLLSKHFNIPHISTGDIFRDNIKNKTELGLRVQEFLNQGLMVPDELTIDLVRDRLTKPDCKRGYILDGFPRNIKQAEFLNIFKKPDFVIYLELSEKEAIERLSARRICRSCGAIYNLKTNPPKIPGVCDFCGGELYQREDDKPDAIKKRIEIYNKESKPILDLYKNIIIKIDASKSVDEIFKEIVDKIKDHKK